MTAPTDSLPDPSLAVPNEEPASHRTFHDQAMALMGRALRERRTASRDERYAWLREALEYELTAAQLTTDPEWRAALYESAAVIARKLKDPEARKLERTARRWALKAHEDAVQKTWWTRLRAWWG